MQTFLGRVLPTKSISLRITKKNHIDSKLKDLPLFPRLQEILTNVLEKFLVDAPCQAKIYSLYIDLSNLPLPGKYI